MQASTKWVFPGLVGHFHFKTKTNKQLKSIILKEGQKVENFENFENVDDWLMIDGLKLIEGWQVKIANYCDSICLPYLQCNSADTDLFSSEIGYLMLY